MKSGTTLTLAIFLGVAGVSVYWFLARQPAAGRDGQAVLPGTNASPGTVSPVAESPSSDSFEATVDRARPPAMKTNASVAGTPLGAALGQSSRFGRHRALFDIAVQADLGQLRALMAQARTLGIPADRRDAVEILLLRWFELDPGSAPGELIDATLAEAASPARSDNLASIAWAWTQVAPADAWGYAARIADKSARMEFEAAVLSAWGSEDPERALQAVLATPNTARRDRLLQLAAANLARDDPQRALALAANLKSVDARPLIVGIVARWAEQDVAAAAQWLAANPRRGQRAIAGQIAGRYGAVDPVAAVAWAQQVDRSGTQYLTGVALAGYAEVNPQDALRMALALEPGTQRHQALGAVLSAIARRDPAYAMENFDKVPAGRARAEVVSAIVQPLVRTDPRAAIEWLKQLDDRAARHTGFSNAAATLADSDPEAASSLIDTIPDDARMRWIAAVANGMVAADPEAAARWLRGFQSEPGYANVATSFAHSLNHVDVEAALEFAASTTDRRQRDQMLQRLMSSGPVRSPDVAARWLDRIGDDQIRASAAQGIAANWASQDFAAARKWATSLESGPTRDQALSALIGNVGASADDAGSLLNQIQSPELRKDAVWQGALRLAQHDLEGARTLIRRFPLDPQRREMLANMLREHYGLTL